MKLLFKTTCIFLISIFLNQSLIANATESGNVYYIDNFGNDNNNGLSPKNAFKTLAKASGLILKGGDKILLKAGQIFQGTLQLKEAIGTIDFPITIAVFGNGKATIQSGDSMALLTVKASYLVVKNLICKGIGRLQGNITNGLDFIHNTNLTVEAVETSGYLFSGIRIIGGSDIHLTKIYAHDNGYCGIHITSDKAGKDNSRSKAIRNVYIGYSVAENNPGCSAIKDNHSGNGILVGGVTNALIEYCEAMNNGWDMPRDGNGPVGIWAYHSDSVVIQHCYSHHNKTSAKGKDGGGFDFDGGITNSTMQYNLSAYNEGAGYGIFQYGGATEWTNNIVRYNISLHDGIKNGECGILMWCDENAVPMKNFHAYNNTIVNKYGHGVNFLPGHYENFVFENNIFLVTDTTDEFTAGKFTGASFLNNLYWNSFHATNGLPQPAVRFEEKPLLADPLLALNPFDSIQVKNIRKVNSIPYFKLKKNSPAANAGSFIDKNGGRDYWDHNLLDRLKTSIGAFQKN